MTRNRITVGFLAGLFLVGSSYGGMIRTVPPETGPAVDQMPLCARGAFDSLAVRSVADVDWFAVRSVPPLRSGYDDYEEPNPSHVLADRQGSVHLCLYALLGLGLFKSTPWVKKFSFGAISGWCLESGRWEIGPCSALATDCVFATSACFIQPDVRGEGPQPVYRLGVVPALWDRSQFLPTILASRGPPSGAGESASASTASNPCGNLSDGENDHETSTVCRRHDGAYQRACYGLSVPAGHGGGVHAYRER